jgi:hypothetical protein
LIAMQGMASGSATISARTGLWGTEANLTASLSDSNRFRLMALAGFRYLRLDDEVISGERFQVSPTVPGFGGSRVSIQDQFRAVNEFYGGQAGVETGARFGRLAIDVHSKFALGQMRQAVDVAGVTNSLSPTGVTTIFPGGLYALRTNGGRHHRNELAFIPEVGLNVGVQVTPWLKVFGGYSLLWVNTVALAGDQIDPVINATQFPIRSGNRLVVGRARPAFPFDESDFWAQGVSLGVELRY